MTPDELNTALVRYQARLADPDLAPEEYRNALAAMRAVRAAYAAVEAAVYDLGHFHVSSGRLLAVGAYGTREHGVVVAGARRGRWRALVAVEADVHVALFAYHEAHQPRRLATAYDLIQARTWSPQGEVPVDTATLAIADDVQFALLVAAESAEEIAGVRHVLCFSNSANADGRYPLRASAQDGPVVAVHAQFCPVRGEPL